MPSYDYRCAKCGKFTITQGIKEKALTSCPLCGEPVSRLIGKNVNIIYKCSGFYCTDTHSPSRSKGGMSENTSEIKAETKTESKAESKAESEAGTKNGNTGADKGCA